MDAHELRPAAVGGVEEGEVAAVRVCSPRADEDGFDFRVIGEVVGEGLAHGFCVAGEVEVVFCCGELDEGIDFVEGVLREDEDGVKFGG